MDLMPYVVAFFVSWQVKTLLALIVLDVVLGVAGSIKEGVFDLAKVAEFYKSMVIPYVIGYLALYLVISYLVPEGFELLNEGLVTVAWATLVGTLATSLKSNLARLYP